MGKGSAYKEIVQVLLHHFFIVVHVRNLTLSLREDTASRNDFFCEVRQETANFMNKVREFIMKFISTAI